MLKILKLINKFIQQRARGKRRSFQKKTRASDGVTCAQSSGTGARQTFTQWTRSTGTTQHSQTPLVRHRLEYVGKTMEKPAVEFLINCLCLAF